MNDLPTFDATEEKVIRYLHRQFLRNDKIFHEERTQKDNGLTQEQLANIVGRLEVLEVLYRYQAEGRSVGSRFPVVTMRISPAICEVVVTLNRPSNYWEILLDWWFSRRWSLPVTVLAVALPLLAQWIEWGYKLWSWFHPASPEP